MKPRFLPSLLALPFEMSLLPWLVDQVLTKVIDPVQIAHTTIILPNRRSCRSFTQLLEEKGKEVGLVLMPHVISLSDINHESVLTLTKSGVVAKFNYSGTLSSVELLLMMTQLVLSWHRTIHLSKPDYPGLTYASAVGLARKLLVMLGEMEQEGDSPKSSFQQSGSLHEYGEMSNEFLKIVVGLLPELAQDEGKISSKQAQVIALMALASYYQNIQPDSLVIGVAMGKMTKARRSLFHSIAALPQGTVVLPGYDTTIMQVEQHEEHYLYTQHQLVTSISKEVVTLSTTNRALSDRKTMLQHCLCPAAEVDQWNLSCSHLRNASSMVEGLQLVAAKDEEEEALVGALALREALETSDKRIIYVTPDEQLAKRVENRLKRFGIDIESSYGKKLQESLEFGFIYHILDCVSKEGAPRALFALLQHPLFKLCDASIYITLLTHIGLRGTKPLKGLEGVQKRLERASKRQKIPSASVGWFNTLVQILTPLLLLWKEKTIDVATLLTTLVDTAIRLSSISLLFGSKAGKCLEKALRDLHEHSALLGQVKSDEACDALKALLGSVRVHEGQHAHPRLAILSPFEARLEVADTVILGGLNADVWPKRPEESPWSSPGFRRSLGLHDHRVTMGLESYEWFSLMMHPQVIMTYAKKRNGANQEASPWVKRLTTVTDIVGFSLEQEPSILNLARTLDLSASKDRPVFAAPTPPKEARPKRYTVTNIERLMRDPYSVYAKEILGLVALRKLEEPISEALFGMIIHRVLEEENTNPLAASQEERLARLLSSVEQQCELSEIPLVYRALWMPSIRSLMEWFIKEDERLQQTEHYRLAEHKGEMSLELEDETIVIEGRADLLSVDQNGKVTIIDYKTGSLPNKDEIKQSYAPQLPLLGWILRHEGINDTQVNDITLEYWHVSGKTKAGKRESIDNPKEQIETTANHVTSLLNQFLKPTTPYMSEPRLRYAPRHSDYRHLARVAEREVAYVDEEV